VDGTGTTKITDKLWLPTEREMFGSEGNSANGETADNQARLEYYTNDNTRVKAWWGDPKGDYPDIKSGYGMWYWTGSAYSYPYASASFCNVHSIGSTNYTSASSAGGVAPAFCVK
jgi:hypothetical protein